jgi:hypothetical protein
MARLVVSLVLVCFAADSPYGQARPDFSGHWTFDRARSAQPWNGRVVIAPILGDECVATQTATSLDLAITVGGRQVTAVYNFAGESRNVSPGEIAVTSRTSWDGDRLVIVSTSESTVNGKAVAVESRRVLWIDSSGSLIIERTGTPASEVTPSRSVYTHVR